MRVVVHLSTAALDELREHGRLVVELRCRPDRDAEVQAQAAVLLAEDPGATANAIHRELGGRRADVLRAVRRLRASEADTSPDRASKALLAGSFRPGTGT